MPDTVKVFGSDVNKKTAYTVGIGLAGILGVVYFRSRKTAAANAAAAATAQSGANTGIDPATGYAYGSAEDAAALSNQGQYASPNQLGIYGSGGNPYGMAGFGGGGYSGYPQGIGGPPFTSNAQWSQYVEEWLVNSMSADPNVVGNALGKYIAGQPLSADMVSIIQESIAFAGYPPISGHAGNPPGYLTASTGSTVPPTNVPPTNGGGGTPSTIKSYVTKPPGHRTLAQLATALGTTPQVIIADTINHPGNVNGGKFSQWLQSSRNGTVGNIPWGLTVFYSPGTH